MPNKQDIADDQAADWAVLLADDPDDSALRARFNDWLRSDPVHRQAWARTQRAWAGLGRLDATTRDAWPGHAARPARRPLKPLVGLAVAACLALMLLPSLTLHLKADYLTGTGEQRAITLDDGSQLHLAPESAVRLAYDDQTRLLEVLRGEAFFEVTPDASRPFHVLSGSTRTTVLGTAFSVNRRDNGTRVTVAHGRVQVEDDSTATQRTLTAGQRLTVSWGDSASFSELPADEVAGWRRGELIAREITIGQVVDALRPYHSGTILVTDGFAGQRVTGLYRLDEPVATLKRLAAAHGGTVYALSPWVLVVSR